MFSTPKALLIALALGLSPTAWGSGIAMTDYTPLKRISQEAADVRADMQSALLEVSVGQQRLQQAQGSMEQAARDYGTDSNDYQLARAHHDQLQRQILSRTLDQLDLAQGRLARAERSTQGQVQQLLAEPANFEALVAGHLRDKRNPQVTAVLLHMAVSHLHARCQELYSKALVGQLEADLEDIEETLRLIGELSAESGGSTGSLESAWARFSGETSGMSLDGSDDAIDGLDALLP